MSKWRPEGWASPSPETHRMGSPTFNIMTEGECVAFEVGADTILEAICEEIEKVGNPYKPPSVHSFAVFEECRLQILTLLRSEK